MAAPTARPIVCIERAGWAIAWDAAGGRHCYRRNVDVVFAGDRIVYVGERYDGAVDRRIDGRQLLVMPGLIDIHCHPTNQPLYKGIREELGNPRLYNSALYDGTAPFQTDDEGRRACAAYALAELLASGVTTVAELSTPYEGWVDVVDASGLRAFLGATYRQARWVVKDGAEVTYAWDAEAGRKAFAEAAAFLDRAVRHPSGRLHGMVCPAQIDTCDEALLADSLALARSRGWPLQIHAGQSVVEFREIVRRHGKTPVQWLHAIGLLGPDVILGHAIFIDEHSWSHWPTRDDLRLLAQSGTTVAHCPTVFSRYGQVLESFGRYRRAGVNVAIGTDTHPHNMLEEMRLAAVLSRVADGDVHSAGAADVFEAATVGAARALGRNDLGRLVAGAKADLVLVDLDHLAMKPARDPLRSLIYTAGERAVRDVFVDGRPVVVDGRVTTIDREAAARTIEGKQTAALAAVPERDPAGRTADQIAPLSLPLG